MEKTVEELNAEYEALSVAAVLCDYKHKVVLQNLASVKLDEMFALQKELAAKEEN